MLAVRPGPSAGTACRLHTRLSRKREAAGSCFAFQKRVRDLQQDASAISRPRIASDRAAMGQSFQEAKRVVDDLARAYALGVGDEADAARIPLVVGIVEPLCCR